MTSVKETPIYGSKGNRKGGLGLELWRDSKIRETAGVMRQRENFRFILLLNKIRVGFVNNEMAKLLLSRVVAKDNPFHPKQAAHMFTKNSSAVDHNNFMLNGMKGQRIPLITSITSFSF